MTFAAAFILPFKRMVQICLRELNVLSEFFDYFIQFFFREVAL